MAERQDAMIAASQLTLAVREAVTRKPGRQVGTVGKIEYNAERTQRRARRGGADHRIARLVHRELDGIADEIRARAATIAAETKTTIEVVPVSANPPAFADTSVQDVVERAARSLNLVNGADAVRRRPRRTDDGAAHADGNDLRAQHWRHQPLAKRAHAVGRLRQRRERAAAVCAFVGSNVTSGRGAQFAVRVSAR